MLRVFYLSCLLLLLSLWPCTALAQEGSETAADPMPEAMTQSPQSLSLEQVLEELRSDFPKLQEARFKLEETRGKLLAKQGAFDTKVKGKVEATPIGYYPKVIVNSEVQQPTTWWGTTFFSGYRLGLGEFAEYDGKKETLNLGEYRIGARVPLLRDGAIDRRRTDIAILELQVAMAQLKIFEKQLEFVDKALKSYWGWVAAEAKREVAQQILELAETRNGQLQTEINVGKKPPIDAVKNAQAVLKRSNKLVEAEQELQHKAYDLSFYLRAARVPQNPPAFPAGRNCVPLAPPLQQAFEQRPERLILQLKQEQNQLAQELAHNQLLPELDFYLALSQDFGQGSKTNEPLEVDTGVYFEFPLQWRKQRGQLQQLEAEQEQLRLQDQLLLVRIRNEVRTAQIARQAACQQIELNQRMVNTSRELALAEMERFRLGSSDLLLVNIREQQIAEAQSKWVDALKDYYIAEGRYFLSLGLLPQTHAEKTP